MSRTQSSNSDEARPLVKLYRKRRANNQDLAVIISDSQNRRGTGKTVFSLKLAEKFDATEEGLTKEKVALSPDELTEAYVEQPKGSALVLDEAEASLSKYEAASSVNRAMREVVSMGRVREKYLVLNLPSASELDRDLKALCDYWALVEEKGRAVGHLLNWNQYAEEPRTPRLDGPRGEFRWEWDDIEDGTKLAEVYEYLHQEKMAHLRGERDESQQKLSPKEVSMKLDRAKETASTETRNELLARVYRGTDLSQSELASALELSRGRVGQIVREYDTED